MGNVHMAGGMENELIANNTHLEPILRYLLLALPLPFPDRVLSIGVARRLWRMGAWRKLAHPTVPSFPGLG